MRTGISFTVSPSDRQRLEAIVRDRAAPQKHVWRARIVLLSADRLGTNAIMRKTGKAKTVVWRWQERFMVAGVDGLLCDKTRPPGKAPTAPETIDRVLALTLAPPPHEATHWTGRAMAEAVSLAVSTVQGIWRAHGLAPHRFRQFKLSRDPAFADKLRAVIGLYVSPPDHAIVLSLDEKSQIQALDRSQPGLPMKKGRCATMTHDYKRHGTTTLFAALNLLDGKVIGPLRQALRSMKRHRHQEFIRFLNRINGETPKHLDIHLIVDNDAAHKTPEVKRRLARHRRFHLHFTPSTASWLNLVERFFAEITRRRIRRGMFHSVADLQRAINDYLEHHNTDPKPFVWTASASSIIEKINRGKQTLESQH